jgi:hypothetical protein
MEDVVRICVLAHIRGKKKRLWEARAERDLRVKTRKEIGENQEKIRMFEEEYIRVSRVQKQAPSKPRSQGMPKSKLGLIRSNPPSLGEELARASGKAVEEIGERYLCGVFDFEVMC